MSEHSMHLVWKSDGSEFHYEKYNRTHTLNFPGGQSLQNSSAPSTFGDAKLTNPEELIAAAASSCHMLTFLAIAAKGRYEVLEYTDDPVAFLGKNDKGLPAVTKITLHPKVQFSEDKIPTKEQLELLHEKSHKYCVIANSLSCELDWELD